MYCVHVRIHHIASRESGDEWEFKFPVSSFEFSQFSKVKSCRNSSLISYDLFTHMILLPLSSKTFRKWWWQSCSITSPWIYSDNNCLCFWALLQVSVVIVPSCPSLPIQMPSFVGSKCKNSSAMHSLTRVSLCLSWSSSTQKQQKKTSNMSLVLNRFNQLVSRLRLKPESP